MTLLSSFLLVGILVLRTPIHHFQIQPNSVTNVSSLFSPDPGTKCPAVGSPSEKKICRCHYGNMIPIMRYKAGFMLHCTAQNESDLLAELSHFRTGGTQVDMILSSSNLKNFGHSMGGWHEINLVGLRLFHNNFTTISPDLFRGLQNKLVHLSLMDKAHSPEMSDIEFEEFIGAAIILKHLKDLFVSVYQISDLNFDELSRLSDTMESMTIVSHRIVALSPPTTNGRALNGLRIFMLQSNLSTIPGRAIMALAPKLRQLTFTSTEYDNLTRADILSLNDGGRAAIHLKMLSLASCRLMRVESGALAPLYDLTYLNLHGNLLSNLDPYTFYNLSRLKELDLSFNGLTSIPKNLLSPLVSMVKLNLRGNLLTTLDVGPFISYATSLMNRVIPPTIKRSFDPTGFSERGIDPEVDLLNFLISDNFTGVATNLTTLKVSLNALTQVSPTMLLLFKNSLNFVDMSHNGLTDDVPFLAFKGFQNLTWLDVSNNKLKNLGTLSWLMGGEYDMKYLGLRGNPWNCDCDFLADLAQSYQDWLGELTKNQVERQETEWSLVTCNMKLTNKSSMMASVTLGQAKAMAWKQGGQNSYTWTDLCESKGPTLGRKFSDNVHSTRFGSRKVALVIISISVFSVLLLTLAMGKFVYKKSRPEACATLGLWNLSASCRDFFRDSLTKLSWKKMSSSSSSFSPNIYNRDTDKIISESTDKGWSSKWHSTELASKNEP